MIWEYKFATPLLESFSDINRIRKQLFLYFVMILHPIGCNTFVKYFTRWHFASGDLNCKSYSRNEAFAIHDCSQPWSVFHTHNCMQSNWNELLHRLRLQRYYNSPSCTSLHGFYIIRYHKRSLLETHCRPVAINERLYLKWLNFIATQLQFVWLWFPLRGIGLRQCSLFDV